MCRRTEKHATFFTRLLLTYGLLIPPVPSRETVLEGNPFHSRNVSVLRELYDRSEYFDAEFHSNWGADTWLLNCLCKDGVPISFLNAAEGSYRGDVTLEEFIELEVRRKRDIVRMLNKEPLFVSLLLEVSAVSTEQLYNWQQELDEDGAYIPQVLDQVCQSIGALDIKNNSLEHEELAENLAVALQSIGEYIRSREMIRHYLNVPDVGEIKIGGRIL